MQKKKPNDKAAAPSNGHSPKMQQKKPNDKAAAPSPSAKPTTKKIPDKAIPSSPKLSTKKNISVETEPIPKRSPAMLRRSGTFPEEDEQDSMHASMHASTASNGGEFVSTKDVLDILDKIKEEPDDTDSDIMRSMFD
jgi:hypothetical protein